MRVVKKAKDEACFLGSGRVPPEVPPRDLPLSPANILKTFTSILSDFEGHETGSDVEFLRSIALNNLPFWQVFPSPMSCMSAGHEHCTFHWSNDVHVWLQPPLLNVQESGNNKRKYQSTGKNVQLEKTMNQEKWSICPHKPYYITFSMAEHKTHLPSSRHTYLALRKSAVTYRVDCKGVALQRKSGGLITHRPLATWQMHLEGFCCKVWQDSSVACQTQVAGYLWSRWV